MIKNYIYKQICNILEAESLLKEHFYRQNMTSRIFVYSHTLPKADNTKHNSAIVESYLGRCNYFRETCLCLQPYSSN